MIMTMMMMMMMIIIIIIIMRVLINKPFAHPRGAEGHLHRLREEQGPVI